MQLEFTACHFRIITAETKQLLTPTMWKNRLATEHATPIVIQKAELLMVTVRAHDTGLAKQAF